jgi:competence protein ComEC
VLLAGDISTQVERILLDSGERLESQVLKVARHGSNSSSSLEFLTQVNPRLAIITGGLGGFGNLPSQETLKRLRERGIRFFRSDLDGATTVRIRGGSPAVRCYATSSADSTAPAAGRQALGGLTFQVR